MARKVRAIFERRIGVLGDGGWAMSEAGPIEGAPRRTSRCRPAAAGRSACEALRGKPFVLYFYPKADTPGCTKEACAFQEALPQLGKIGLDGDRRVARTR